MPAFQPAPTGPQAQQTVTIRVQVVDLHSFTLDLQVPTYLKARDLTQRVARDAGLIAHWEGGRRRLYWLRARGRLLGDDETLADLGVIDGELVYLLPEPPAGSGVVEQTPDYPQTRGYAGRGVLAMISSLLLVVVWSVGWGLAMSVERSELTVWVPGLALGLLCTGFARHAWSGAGSQLRVVLTALVLFPMLMVMASLVPFLYGADPARLFSEVIGGLIFGVVGVFMGWMAWWGAVEPLPKDGGQQQAVVDQAAAAVVPCAICGGDVTADVRWECQYGCGRYFHVGCYKARTAVYRGDSRKCAVCSAVVG